MWNFACCYLGRASWLFLSSFFFVLKSVSTQYSAKDISVYARDFSNDRSVIVSVLHTFCFVQTTIFSTGCYQSGNTPVQCVKKKRPPNIQCPVEVLLRILEPGRVTQKSSWIKRNWNTTVRSLSDCAAVMWNNSGAVLHPTTHSTARFTCVRTSLALFFFLESSATVHMIDNTSVKKVVMTKKKHWCVHPLMLYFVSFNNKHIIMTPLLSIIYYSSHIMLL